MKKKHSWKPVIPSNKLKHAECKIEGCGLQKYFDSRIGKLVYLDKFGHLLYKTPSCVIPKLF